MQSIIKIPSLVGVKQVAAGTIATADIDFSGWTWVANALVTSGLVATGGSGTGLTVSSVIVNYDSLGGTNTTTLNIGDGGAGYVVGDVISVTQTSGANFTGPITVTLTEAMFDLAQNSIATPANGIFYGPIYTKSTDPATGYTDIRIGLMQNNSNLEVPLYDVALSGTAGDAAKYNRVFVALDRALVKAAQRPGVTVDLVTEAGVEITEIKMTSSGKGGK